MNKLYVTLSLALACLNSSTFLSAVSIRTPPVDIDVGPYAYYREDPYYHVWVGPGWYYGRYFSSEREYNHWLDNRFYSVRWEGPGWYYGIYFDSKRDFNRYRRHHRNQRSRYRLRGNTQFGSQTLHKVERRGRWSSK